MTTKIIMKSSGFLSAVRCLVSVISPLRAVVCRPSSVLSCLSSVVLILSASAWAGDLTVDNMAVIQDATIYGKIYFGNGLVVGGGNITMNGGYWIHTFTNSSTFTVSGGSVTCDVLVVAGGGGGGYGQGSQGGGGGGAGGMVEKYNHVLTNGASVALTVGGGGSNPSGYNPGGNGTNSVFDTMTAVGGGGGAYMQDSTHDGIAGGSGGGGSSGGAVGEGGNGTQGNSGGGTGYGNYGGRNNSFSPYNGGGGGGAGYHGGDGGSGGYGDGGNGRTNSFSGTSTTYCGGGGSGKHASAPRAGYGGNGGGGAGGANAVGSNGGANTGGGGGGGSGGNKGGSGGSGIVIVRYPVTTSSNSTLLSISFNGISQASASGSNVFMSKVGIGTNNPAEILHVVGNVQVDGSLKLGGEAKTSWSNVTAGLLSTANHLSELTDLASVRSNLGLGSASTYDSGSFIATNGDGSQLTGITAAQVGAVATNGDGSQLTGITAAQVGALSVTGDVVLGDLSVSNLMVTKDATIIGNMYFSSTIVESNGGGTATGGTITTNGNYRIHTFTNVDTTSFIVSGGSLTCDVLVVAGGGGGGSYGGGGAGGMTNASLIVTDAISVVVGAGGPGHVSVSTNNGGNSSFGFITVVGGGGGGGYYNGGVVWGTNGGSGGGGGYESGGNALAGTGIEGQGHGGGNGGPDSGGSSGGGGGGGASEGGAVGTSSDEGGKGGDGLASSLSGSSVTYSGGGGGANNEKHGGAGGAGGGGHGGTGSGVNMTAGAANTGGGGGGNGNGNTAGAAGGSGIVIVRYPIITSSNVTTLSISSNGISQTSASGSNVFMSKVGIGTNSPAEQLHVAGNARVDGTNIVSAIKLGGETRSTWPTGNLSVSNNLSDITNKAVARTNLGLGTAATNDASAFDSAGAAGVVDSTLSAHTADLNNPHQVTAVQAGALSTTGGVVNGEISLVAPAGDIPMGVYTNQ